MFITHERWGLFKVGGIGFMENMNVSHKKLVWEPPFHHILRYVLHQHGDKGVNFEIQNSQILQPNLKRKYTKVYVV